MASSFPKSFPHSFFSLFLTSHFAYCYYSKATRLVFWGGFLETDTRIFLQGVNFSRNVESYQKHVELILAFNGSFILDGSPRRVPPPLKKFRLHQEKICQEKKLRAKEMQRWLAPPQKESTRKTIPTNHLHFLSFLFLIFRTVSLKLQVSLAPSESFLYPHYYWRQLNKGAIGGLSDRSGLQWRVFAVDFFKCPWTICKAIL